MRKLRVLSPVVNHKDQIVSQPQIWSLGSLILPFTKQKQCCCQFYLVLQALKTQSSLQVIPTLLFLSHPSLIAHKLLRIILVVNLPSNAYVENKIMRPTESFETKPSAADNDQDMTRDCHPANSFGPPQAVRQGVVLNNSQNDSRGIGANRNNIDPSFFQPDVKNVLEEPISSKEEFPSSPSDHQSILVSLSSRCMRKGTVCERSHLFRIKYYGNFDKPLGRFLRDNLFDQSYRCRSCEMPSEVHVHCYTHRQGTLIISVKKLPEFLLPGEKEGKIWMWHRCLRCPRTNGISLATRRIVMSDAAWGLSFGKFFELSFSNHAAASRVASCGNSLH